MVSLNKLIGDLECEVFNLLDSDSEAVPIDSVDLDVVLSCFLDTNVMPIFKKLHEEIEDLKREIEELKRK